MTAEELKKQEADKVARAVKKSFYVSMAKYHEGEVVRYNKQADDCDQVVLAPQGAPGQFGGL